MLNISRYKGNDGENDEVLFENTNVSKNVNNTMRKGVRIIHSAEERTCRNISYSTTVPSRKYGTVHSRARQVDYKTHYTNFEFVGLQTAQYVRK